jgi:hypothetical protein
MLQNLKLKSIHLFYNPNARALFILGLLLLAALAGGAPHDVAGDG